MVGTRKVRDKQGKQQVSNKYEIEFNKSAENIGAAAVSQLGDYARLVSSGIMLGLIGWDSDGKSDDGMGRAKNDKNLWQKIAESMGTDVSPRSYVSNITRIVMTRSEWAGFYAKDETLRQATINTFVDTFRSLDGVSKGAREPKAPKGRTMAQAVASLLAEGVKYEWDMKELTVEFLAQVTTLVEGE
jgi:hypothetical protein